MLELLDVDVWFDIVWWVVLFVILLCSLFEVILDLLFGKYLFIEFVELWLWLVYDCDIGMLIV